MGGRPAEPGDFPGLFFHMSLVVEKRWGGNMASVTVDHGLCAAFVRTFLTAVTLSACSQEPAEQASRVREPTPEKRAEARADCRDEVQAAFERLKASGRPYRKEVTFVVGGQQPFHGTVEFLPPDRMRETTNNGVPGYGTIETIRVGQRAWLNSGGWPSDWRWPWGWREWNPWLMQMSLEKNKDFSTLLDYSIPAGTAFECLGKVEFNGAAYLGYRARLEKRIATIAQGPLSEARQQELARRFQQMPQEWRTVFVDPQSGLPAYDLVAQENQLDSPSNNVRYTYPSNIKIEPPLWCRVGLCSSVVR